MFTFQTCNGYKTIHTEPGYAVDAPSVCARLEQERDDGFAVVACRNGSIVADAEGWWENHGSTPSDAATATGMYDAL